MVTLAGHFLGTPKVGILIHFFGLVMIPSKDTLVSCQEVEAWFPVPGASREEDWDLNIYASCVWTVVVPSFSAQPGVPVQRPSVYPHLGNPWLLQVGRGSVT